MSQDKYIKKHQQNLEVLREQVRDRKDEILTKIDVQELLDSPSRQQYLLSIGTDFYANNSDKVEASIKNGEKLANKILNGKNVQSKNKEN